MSYKSDCLELFGTKDLYQILNLDFAHGKGNIRSSVTNAKIKKAYYHQSILWHPDRFSSNQHNEEAREMAKRKFQVISRAYSILGDNDKRKAYDETGMLDDEDDFESRDWTAVWRGMFKKVTPEEIEAYLTKFRGSQDEMDEVKMAYIKHKGNMDKILASVIGADVHNEDRIREIIRHFIERGELTAYACFVNEPPGSHAKRVKRAQREAAEAERALKEMQQKEKGSGEEGCSSSDHMDLSSMIMAKQQKRAKQQEDFLVHLTKKYGAGNEKEEPTKKKARKDK